MAAYQRWRWLMAYLEEMAAYQLSVNRNQWHQ
jgi:hypothetical protein